ncbi:T9SS type A sorting domain-containing protein [Seonamhaeicola algicola]|uniref:T9SS type A sorting domain-containing protein n=1 Tax=Seonamhaeicola algicola TaxID=1719036 RepID=A0A5C7AI72_9FLAO|nr:T9SS type A sorting domain-containing protein [Seonamhaeicola algicola]TXE06265.1 T9SS type A sorting domain-containing protein [Seonamhaeicola algicola]
MKKKLLLASLALFAIIAFCIVSVSNNDNQKIVKVERKNINPTKKGKKKTPEERALYNEARNLYEYYRQVNPNTGIISKNDKKREFKQAKNAKLRANINLTAKVPQAAYISRGPSNMGGRTRALVVDKSDNTGNTIIAGGVSGGVFRTTDGGANWTKVSPNDEIHNVTAIAQDPRAGFENVWYYATGEGLGNSASSSAQQTSGAYFFGQGIWQSINGGVTWVQMPSTDSNYESFDSDFDVTYSLAVHPLTGHLYAASIGLIARFDGSSWTTEIDGNPSSTGQATDIVITTSGRCYAAFSGIHDTATEGIWTSPTGVGSWTRINDDGISADFTPEGRVVLALAPSNENKLYTLFVNGNSIDCNDPTPLQEADLWMWNQSTTNWTNYSSKLPDEAGCSEGNDPFAAQDGYDLVVNVKPDNENFVVIGGTNAYKIENITTDAMFSRIGGYASSSGYTSYSNHHPDIHALVFNPFNNNVLFSGTDGGVHVTNDITANTISWTSLNNNYQTFQFYHVDIDPGNGSDFVIGGAQDNGCVLGGTFISLPNLTEQLNIANGDGASTAISRDTNCNSGIGFFISLQNGVTYRNCGTYVEITPESAPGTPYDSQFVTYFHLDPDNNNALYFASLDKLLRTTDATNVTQDNWTDLGNTTAAFGHNDQFEIFSTTRGTYNPASSYLLMGGDSGHIYRLNDPQNATNISSAVDITPPTASTTFPSIVSGLAIHPTNNDIVLATYSNYGINSIYLTTNATSASPNWTLVERNLSSHSIRSAAITEVAGQTLYFVGTARGLYSTTDPTSIDWVREAPNQIGFAVVSSLAYRPSDNHLLIGTHGNGMYEATVSDVLGIEDVNDVSSEIKLYPNPVANQINLDLPVLNNKYNYSIIDMSGKTITNGTTDSKQINVSTLSSGMYFIKLNFDGKTGVKRFIKK